MPGFRPGKVPPNLIRKMHGESLRQDALNRARSRPGSRSCCPRTAFARRSARRSSSIDDYEPGKDAEVKVVVEALPSIPDAEARRSQARAADRRSRPKRRSTSRSTSSPRRARNGPMRRPSTRRPNGDQVVMDFAGIGRRQGVRRRHRHRHGGRARLGPADPGLRGAAGRRQGRRQARGQRHVPGRLPGRRPQGPATRGSTVEVTAVKTAGENVVDDDFAKTLGLDRPRRSSSS